MDKPWRWDIDAVKQTVGAVRAGRSLAPSAWPATYAAAQAGLERARS